jgi:hypothetical protein
MTLAYPSAHVHGNFRVDSLGGRFGETASQLQSGHAEDAGNPAEQLDFSRIAFVDTETTGLSGGAGVHAFLVGIGYLANGGFTVEQFFMSDFPAEPEMLEKVMLVLNRFDVIASYNGRSFDMPLLDTRLAMNGIRERLSERPQLDLLHPARRIWKHRLESCSLQSIETNVLGFSREGDIEGWLIPQAYFDFLHTGNRSHIDPVIHHNRLDILSLALVAQIVLSGTEVPGTAQLTHAPDWFGLGTLLEKHRRVDEAAFCYEKALALGLSGELAAHCARLLSLGRKRSGDWDGAVKLWSEGSETTSGGDALFALEELAKYYEHRAHDFKGARDACHRAIALLEIREATAAIDISHHFQRFEYRLRRIEKKARGHYA